MKCASVLPALDTATDTITLSLKCLRPLMRRSLDMADFFFVAEYSRSFWVLIGGCTVKIFSSENHTLSTVCKHLLCNNVLQHLTRFSRSESDSSCAFLRRKTLSFRSLLAICRTELWDIPVIFWISLGLLLDPGLSSWLHISSATRLTFCAVLTVLGRPLPAFQQIEFVASVLHKRSLTELTDHFLLRNYKYVLHPIPFLDEGV